VFTEVLLSKLKETHGESLVPIVKDMHRQFMILSNYLVNF